MSGQKIGILKNLIYAFGAQAISLILSFFMALVVPKILGVEGYGYWQLFLFYSSYAGCFMIGINDGIYLRKGGTEYAKLNYVELRTQYWFTFFFQIIIAIVISIFSIVFMSESERIWVFLGFSLFIIVNNTTNYLSSILQASNKTYHFSKSVIIEKAILFFLLLIFVVKSDINFKIIILSYIGSRIAALIYSIIFCKEIVVGKIKVNINILLESFNNIKVGIVLMISNVISTMILGIGRVFIDGKWGVEMFGKISFSLSITNFFLQFISQISMVLFPALRMFNSEQQIKVYRIARIALSHALTLILVFYVPIIKILELWLPEYSESLTFMIYTLVICIFDGKMQLLFGTYMKVLRKEKALFCINAISVIISTGLCFVSAYVFENFYAVVLCMVISIMLRSIVSEIYIGRILEIKYNVLLINEILLASIFILCNWLKAGIVSFVVYLLFYLISLWLDRNNIKILLEYIIPKLQAINIFKINR